MGFAERWNEKVNIPELLLSLDVDLEEDGLTDTPERVAKSWAELLQGYTLSPEDILARPFESEGEGLVLCRNIEFTSVCMHHFIPFFGVCHIGYMPDKKIAGLSKLARLVDCFAQRLQIQERLVYQIREAIVEHLEPEGVLVVAKARHLCCLGRGVKRVKMDFVCSSQKGEVDSSLYGILLGGA